MNPSKELRPQIDTDERRYEAPEHQTEFMSPVATVFPVLSASICVHLRFCRSPSAEFRMNAIRHPTTRLPLTSPAAMSTRSSPGSASQAHSWFLASAFVALTLTLAAAQPVPKINSISPEWLQRGQSVEISLTGENLAQTTQFLISGEPGLSATLVPMGKPAMNLEASQGGISAIEVRQEKTIRAKITIAAEAALGERELRLATPDGVSNPLTIEVGSLPELTEGPRRDDPLQAQKIELPAALSGKIGAPAEIDYFRIAAKKGQNLIVDVFASRFGSALDPSLALLNAAGQELARSEDVNGLDPLLVFPIPEDGEYLVQIRDFRFQGGDGYRYRVVAGVIPYVYSVFPFGGRRGQNLEVEVRGHNLDQSRLMIRVEPEAPLGRQDIRAQSSLGFSNPFPFDVADLAEIGETEPNSTFEQAQVVTVPAVVNARINGKKDRDVFKLKAEKGQTVIFEIMANRYGSPLDALLTLSDAKGRVIERNDDALGADARIEHQFEEAGDYAVTIEDLLSRGGDTYGYRLALRRPQSDFAVRFLPDNPRLHRGGHAAIRCELTRLAGFNETVRVALDPLPPGLFAEPLLLPPGGPGSGWLVLSATPECPVGPVRLKVSATSTIAGRPVTRKAIPLSGDKPVQEAFLSVLEAAPFTLELTSLMAELEQGQSTTIEIMARRRDGFTGEIKLSADGFSAGRDPITKSLEIGAVTLKGSESQTLLRLSARLDSEIGTRPILVKGEATVNGRTVTQYAIDLPLTVRPVPFVLTTSLQRLSVAALPENSDSGAREAVFTIKADRRSGFTNEIALSLEGAPAGITVVMDKIPANATEATVRLIAQEKSPAGQEFPLRILGVGSFHDRIYRQRPGEIKLTVTVPESAPTVATKEAK